MNADVKSTHRVEIIRVPPIEKHPNADTLGIVTIWGGYSVVVRLGEFREGDLAAYIPPDSVVPETPTWEFLKGKRRIRAIKLRGCVSVGLLIHAPNGSNEGDDVAAQLGITHYEPKVNVTIRGGEDAPNPPGHFPDYDMESIRRYGDVIQSGEEVVVSEKLDGANVRIAHVDGEIHVGSHHKWKKWSLDSTLWSLLSEDLLKGLLSLPSPACLYGEMFGPVQSLRYGLTTPQFRLFDIWTQGHWMCYDQLVSHADRWHIPRVPEIYRGPFGLEQVLSYAEGSSLIPGANHMREGCVVKLVEERHDRRVGRVILKAISTEYWARKEQQESRG